MAEGALARSAASLAIAITGVAGPDPDEDGNPVGLVCIAVARKNFEPICVEKRHGDVGRDSVQERAITDALMEAIRIAEAT
jgi:nicotinamide-nucleotide amidase